MPLPPTTPDLESLDLLLSVAELGSVGRAARAHGVSQPAASARLRRLERRLDLGLLTRTPTGSTLTPVGHAFAAWARDVVLAAHRLDDNVAALRASRSARLRVAASLTNAEYVLPSWLLLLRREHPQVEVAAQVANSREVCERVRTGAADLGFVEMPVVPPDLSHVDVGTDRLALVAAPGYPDARRSGALSPRDLFDRPLLLRESGSGTRETFLEALRVALGADAVPELPHAVELGSTTTILATARAGGGIGVVSERAARADLAGGSLVPVAVTGLDAVRTLRAVWTGAAASPPARQLIEVALRDGAARR